LPATSPADTAALFARVSTGVCTSFSRRASGGNDSRDGGSGAIGVDAGIATGIGGSTTVALGAGGLDRAWFSPAVGAIGVSVTIAGTTRTLTRATAPPHVATMPVVPPARP